jgi:hypothetical protein
VGAPESLYRAEFHHRSRRAKRPIQSVNVIVVAKGKMVPGLEPPWSTAKGIEGSKFNHGSRFCRTKPACSNNLEGFIGTHFLEAGWSFFAAHRG